MIASGEFKSRTVEQSQIRNLTLQIVVKVLSNLLFTKVKMSKVTNEELQMIYAGVEDEIRVAQARIPLVSAITSPGFFLIQMFYDKRYMLNKGIQDKD